jgi:hypothetical protein
MSVTVIDAMDAILGGQAQAQEFQHDFLEQWNAPLIKSQMKMAWMQMPPEQKDALKKSNPEMYAQTESFFSS